jgi:hypothetical protein
MSDVTLADVVDRIEKLRASFVVRNKRVDQSLVAITDTLLKLMPLADRLREHAASVHVDGTPAQVGLSPTKDSVIITREQAERLAAALQNTEQG